MSRATSAVAMWSRIGPALRSQKVSSRVSSWATIASSASVTGKAKGSPTNRNAWSSERKQRSGLLLMIPRIEADDVVPGADLVGVEERAGEEDELDADPPGPPGLTSSEPMRCSGEVAGNRISAMRIGVRCGASWSRGTWSVPHSKGPNAAKHGSQRMFGAGACGGCAVAGTVASTATSRERERAVLRMVRSWLAVMSRACGPYPRVSRRCRGRQPLDHLGPLDHEGGRGDAELEPP